MPALSTLESFSPLDRPFAWHDPRRAGMRLVASAVAGAAVALGLREFSWAVRALAGWNAFSLVLLVLAWWVIGKADPVETQRRAGAEDPGRTAVWVIVLVSSTISLFAATIVLRQAKRLDPEASGALAILCLSAVAASWLLTHTAFTLRYARLYYRDDAEGVGGLEFPGPRSPDDFDFAYFAFTIGMCFQVSDVTVSSYVIRRTVLVHAIISFAYNTTILALALNLVFGLFG
jgi:uncharacterized membrane protein